MSQPTYDCPGRSMPQPEGAPEEGYVACYRAGHECPPAVTITDTANGSRHTTVRCPCCGDMKLFYSEPAQWADLN